MAGFATRLVGNATLVGDAEHTTAYLFFAVGVVTLLYALRLFRFVFLGSASSGPSPLPAPPTSLPMQAIAGALVLGLLFFGLLPGIAIELLAPALEFTTK
jgi:hypothetical protein